MYRVSAEEVQKQQNEYKKNYPPFQKYQTKESEINRFVSHWENLVETQNGQDTDDYSVETGNKVEKYTAYLDRNIKLLLLGTGTGREVVCAKSLGFDAHGTTLGSRNVYFANNYLGLKEITECLNEGLPFYSESWDAVQGYQVFEHTISPLIFLLEIGRVLKPGGKLFLEWPPPKSHTGDSNPHHQVCFTPGQAKGLFQKAGFINIELLDDKLNLLPEEEYWKGDQDYMLCIRAIKGPTPPNHTHIYKSWKL
jgi:SAM-dependent methyltransferase